MTGGFFDTRRTKLSAWKGYKKRLTSLEAAEEAWKSEAAKLALFNDEVSKLAAKLAKSTEAWEHYRRRHDHLASTVAHLKRKIERGELALKASEESLHKAKRWKEEVVKKRAAYEEDLAKSRSEEDEGREAEGAVWTPEDQERLVNMAKEIAKLEGPGARRESSPKRFI